MAKQAVDSATYGMPLAGAGLGALVGALASDRGNMLRDTLYGAGVGGAGGLGYVAGRNAGEHIGGPGSAGGTIGGRVGGISGALLAHALAQKTMDEVEHQRKRKKQAADGWKGFDYSNVGPNGLISTRTLPKSDGTGGSKTWQAAGATAQPAAPSMRSIPPALRAMPPAMTAIPQRAETAPPTPAASPAAAAPRARRFAAPLTLERVLPGQGLAPFRKSVENATGGFFGDSPATQKGAAAFGEKLAFIIPLPAWGGREFSLSPRGKGIGLTGGWDHLLGVVPVPNIGVDIGGPHTGVQLSGPIPGIGIRSGFFSRAPGFHTEARYPRSLWKTLSDKARGIDYVENEDQQNLRRLGKRRPDEISAGIAQFYPDVDAQTQKELADELIAESRPQQPPKKQPQKAAAVKLARNMGLSDVPTSAGPDQITDALFRFNQLRSLVRPTDETLKGRSLSRKGFQHELRRIASGSQDKDRYELSSMAPNPALRAAIAGAAGLAGTGALTYADGLRGLGTGLAGTGLLAGGAYLHGMHQRNNFRNTAKLLKDYGLLRPQLLRQAYPLLGDDYRIS